MSTEPITIMKNGDSIRVVSGAAHVHDEAGNCLKKRPGIMCSAPMASPWSRSVSDAPLADEPSHEAPYPRPQPTNVGRISAAVVLFCVAVFAVMGTIKIGLIWFT